MADKGMRTIELEEGEIALIVGEDGDSMSIRVATGIEAEEFPEEVSDATEIVVALATRLLNDPDFHDQMVEWYHTHAPEDDEDDPEA